MVFHRGVRLNDGFQCGSAGKSFFHRTFEEMGGRQKLQLQKEFFRHLMKITGISQQSCSSEQEFIARFCVGGAVPVLVSSLVAQNIPAGWVLQFCFPFGPCWHSHHISPQTRKRGMKTWFFILDAMFKPCWPQ